MLKFKKIQYVYFDGWAAEGTDNVSAFRRPRVNLTFFTTTSRTPFLKGQLNGYRPPRLSDQNA